MMMMTQAFNPTNFAAFAAMLARPDPKDLPRRANVLRCKGDPNRRATRLPPLMMVWLQRHYLETEIEEPILAAAPPTWNRRARPVNPGLRVLRPTGTG